MGATFAQRATVGSGGDLTYDSVTGILSNDAGDSVTLPIPTAQATAAAAAASAAAAAAAIPVNAIVDGDFSAAQGIMVKDSSGVYRAIKCNYTAVVAPAVTDDIDLGYVVGSEWIDTVLGLVYRCVANTDGAASWKLLG